MPTDAELEAVASTVRFTARELVLIGSSLAFMEEVFAKADMSLGEEKSTVNDILRKLYFLNGLGEVRPPDRASDI